jgi:branched-chain amino acid transport system ATP-binding protein
VSEGPEDDILTVRDLAAGYGRVRVLFGVSIAAPRRGVVAVLGRNGAGKTTLMRAIVGELQAQGGRILFDGTEATRLPTEARARAGLGYVPQEHAVFARLTVRENLEIGADAGPRGRRGGIERALAAFPKLGQRLGQVAGTLSGGERKMLAIGRALLGEPRLLLLDEPTEGVWVGVIEEIAERLAELAREVGVVLVEQHLELALRLARRAYVMERGRVALVGPSAEIREDPRLMRYLAP